MICVEDIDLRAIKIQGNGIGKRTHSHTHANSGRYIRATQIQYGERAFDVAIDATLRAALIRQGVSRRPDRFSVSPQDLRKKVFKRPRQTLIVFAVDASDSMGQGTYARIKAAKGAVLAILAKARRKRHRVSMVAFRDKTAQVILQPTSSLTLARKRLKSLPTGGATPFADGLMKSWQIIMAQRLKDPEIIPLLVVISDGEANVPYDRDQYGLDVMTELHLISRRISQDSIQAIVIDTSPLSKSGDEMKQIAQSLDARYHHITGLRAANVVDTISEL